MAKGVCASCGEQLGMFSHPIKFADGKMICGDCARKNKEEHGLELKDIPFEKLPEWTYEEYLAWLENPSSFSSASSSAVENYLEKATEKAVAKREAYNHTTILGPVSFCDSDQTIKISKGMFGSKKFAYSDLLDFELIEDGSSVTKGGLGRAAVGAVVFGPFGAVVGAVTGGKKEKKFCESLKIKVTAKNVSSGAIYIDLIKKKTKTKSGEYKRAAKLAQDLLSQFQIACDAATAQQAAAIPVQDVVEVAQQAAFSPADEIMKMKQLLDMGVLTQEEFDAKKKELLGL